MLFFTRALTEQDAQEISAWNYAAPYDVYAEEMVYAKKMPCRALVDKDGMLCGFFCWEAQARVLIAQTLYQAFPDALDFGIGLRPGLTGRGLGVFATTCALNWLRDAFAPPAFRLSVYEWNVRAQRVYERVGFVPQTKRGDFLIMTRDERPWRDASRPLENGMPVYPFDPGFDRHLHYRKEDKGWDMSVFAMSAHTGTHVDAPAHIGQPGGVETIPFERFEGVAQVLDWSDMVDMNMLMSPRVLCKMAERGFTPAQAQRLIDAGVVLVGVDGMSVGEGETEWAVHKLLLDAGVTIVENAALEDFAPGWYAMRCYPLNMPGSDGAPARLMLRAMK